MLLLQVNECQGKPDETVVHFIKQRTKHGFVRFFMS